MSVEVLHFFRCSLAQRLSVVLLLGGRDPGRVLSALLLCHSHLAGLQPLGLSDPALEFYLLKSKKSSSYLVRVYTQQP